MSFSHSPGSAASHLQQPGLSLQQPGLSLQLMEALGHICLSLNPTASLQLSLANRPSSFLRNKVAAHRKKGFSTHRQL